MAMKIALPIIAFFIFVICTVFSTLSVWESLAVSISIYFFCDFLENLGKKIVVMDLAIIMAVFTCLIMPVVFYHDYTQENLLARIWVKYMPIPSDEYFSFVLPAILAMVAGLKLRINRLKVNENPQIYLNKAKKYLADKPNLGLTLMAVGVVSGLLDFLSPQSLRQVFYLLDHLTYVGVFYILYSPNKHKKLIVPGVILLMVSQTLITGMFGDFIFMLACTLTLVLLGTQISFRKKLIYALAGMFLIILIQSVKVQYRKKSWSEGEADPIYFGSLVTDRLADPSSMFDTRDLFFTSVRMNQGWLVANTMYKVPAKYPFANGETIWQSIAAAIVPRFLWPDKPEAGGKANLKRFWGYNIVGFSMNIGPLGEAYANFDRTGGIAYMFFYGLFFNLMLSTILKLAERTPTLVFWLPFLFFYAIGVETDLLTTMGSIIKGTFFTWLVFKIFHIAFRIDL